VTPEPSDTPDRDRVRAFIRETLAEQLAVDVADIPEEARLYTLPGIDSLKALKTAMTVEKEFGVAFDSGQVVVTGTVGELADLVVAAVQEQQS
jgi:acyl carrier protein